jgi:hypothetical protein
MSDAAVPDRDKASTGRIAVAGDRVLLAVGAAGLLVSLLCLVAVAVRGRFIPPEGKMLDAATFTFGVAVFTLTVALLLPLAGYSSAAARRWRWAYCVFAVYGLVLESIQSFRGLDPRFTEAGGSVDGALGIIFGFTALLNTVVFVLLGLRFFRADALADRPVLRIGIRYGVVAVWLSFGVGILMSVISGRDVGDEGNLLLSHGLGVHGIQTVPLVALVLAWSRMRLRRSWVHVAGIGWLAACTAALVQALLGRPPLDASVLTMVIVVGLAIWVAAAGYAGISWIRATRYGAA